MKKNPPLTEEQVKRARKLRQDGLSWSAIGRAIGVYYETVRRHIDPDFLARDKQRSHYRTRTNPVPTGRAVTSQFRPTEKEFQAARKLIPLDTRDLTARLLGDPLPGRRALDMRGAK